MSIALITAVIGLVAIIAALAWKVDDQPSASLIVDEVVLSEPAPDDPLDVDDLPEQKRYVFTWGKSTWNGPDAWGCELCSQGHNPCLKCGLYKYE